MTTKTMHIGILSRDAYINRTFAIVRGKYRRRKNEPKLWFESLKALAQVLSDENRQLLKLIIEHKPQSLAELEKLSSRTQSDLSRTLKTLANFRIVDLPKDEYGRIAPAVKVTDFCIEFGLGA